MNQFRPPRILTIAGSDSGGGAGIQADLKTFQAHRCYGMSAIVALTAQNTLGVTGVHETPPQFVAAQLDAVLSDIGCDAAKTGMLGSAAIIAVVAEKIREHCVLNLVVDPVMVSKSGHRLLAADAVEAMRRALVPLARVITPNLEEVEELIGARPSTVDQMRDAARELGKLGCEAVLVKGGHLAESDLSTDVLWDGEAMHEFSAPRLDARHTHGTGCTLSAAIAANLGKGLALPQAVERAKNYLQGAIAAAYALGSGIGPVDHLWQMEDQSAKREA